MKTAWLIVNGFLTSEKFEEIYQWLIDAAAKREITLRKITNDQLTSIIPASNRELDWKQKPEFVIFWDKDIKLYKLLEQVGFRVFNNSRAIEICDDKGLTFLTLKNKGIKMPQTYPAPMTFHKEYKELAFVHQVGETIGYPMIIKENKGSFGEQVYLVNDFREAIDRITEIGHSEFVMQEYVKSSKGRDIRINVVGDKVVTAMERFNFNDFRANVTNGGSMKRCEITKDQEEMAIKACKAIGLDFGGVDLLFDENNQPVMCEINSNAHFKNIYDCTGVNVAEHIIDYILSK